MKNKYINYLFFFASSAFILNLTPAAKAQRIRKDYREMTVQEKTNYKNAINNLNNNSTSATLNAYNPDGVIEAYRATHLGNFGQHGSEAFFPWHRQFLYNFETELLNKNPKVTLPCWDWRYDRTAASAGFWGTDAGFLQSFNTAWGLGRSPMTDTWLPTVAEVASNQSQTLFSNFLDYSEGSHGTAHVWVGGSMRSANTSPSDPSFYLHHAFVDYLWQAWEDQTPGVQSSFAAPNTNPVQPFNIAGDSLIDSRKLKVWYATHNEATGSGNLLLNGFNGGNYAVSGTEYYRYTGAINATSFIVPSGTTCYFMTSGRITEDVIRLSPGFRANTGSTFRASVGSDFFTTARLGEEELAKDEYKMGASEVDAMIVFEKENTLSISFHVPAGSNISQLSVYDLAGRPVVSVAKEASPEINYEVTLSALPDGMYFVSALVDGELKSKKFIHKNK